MGLVKSLWVVGGESSSHRGEEWAKFLCPSGRTHPLGHFSFNNPGATQGFLDLFSGIELAPPLSFLLFSGCIDLPVICCQLSFPVVIDIVPHVSHRSATNLGFKAKAQLIRLRINPCAQVRRPFGSAIADDMADCLQWKEALMKVKVRR